MVGIRNEAETRHQFDQTSCQSPTETCTRSRIGAMPNRVAIQSVAKKFVAGREMLMYDGAESVTTCQRVGGWGASKTVTTCDKNALSFAG